MRPVPATLPRLILMAVTAFLYASAGHAEPPGDDRVLTPRIVLESVWDHHPRLKQELIRLAEANARSLAAVGAFDTTFNASNRSWLDGFYSGNTVDSYIEVPVPQAGGTLRGGYRVGRGEYPVYEDEYQTLDNGEWRLEGSVSLLRNFSIDERRLAVQLAELDTHAAELGIEASRILLGQAALEQYWNWVLQWKVTRIYEKLLTVAEERQKQLDARVAAGDLAAFEALDNKRTILQRKSLLVRQRAQARQAARKLGLFVRGEGGEPRPPDQSEVPVNLPEPASVNWQAEALLAKATEQRPDLRTLEVQIKQLKQEIAFAESRFLPELRLGGIVSQDDGAGNASREGTEVKMLLGLEVPLQQRKNRGAVLAAEAKLRRVELAQIFLKEQIENTIAIALLDLEQSKERYSLSLAEKQTTLELADGEFARFRTGDSNLLFLNIREVGAAEAQVKVYEALRENLVQAAVLAAATGDFEILSLTPDGLQ